MKNTNKSAKESTRERVYNFIVEFMQKNGYSPSVREICDGTDLKSTSSVYTYLIMLKMLGKIDMKENAPRTIRLIGYKLIKAEKII